MKGSYWLTYSHCHLLRAFTSLWKVIGSTQHILLWFSVATESCGMNCPTDHPSLKIRIWNLSKSQSDTLVVSRGKHGSQALLLNREPEAHSILMHFFQAVAILPECIGRWNPRALWLMQPPFSATLADRFLHVSSRALALHILWPPLLFHPFPFYLSALCAAAPCTGTGSDGLQVQQSCDLCGDSFILFDSQAVFNIQWQSFVLWSFVMI